MSENFISSTMQLENLEKEKIDSVEETQMDSKTLNKKKNKEKKNKKEKAADKATEDGNRKSAESEMKKKKKKKKKKREIEESLEKSADEAHKMNEKDGKMESLSSEANGNGGKKRKGAVADGDAGTDTKKRNINGHEDGETTDRVKPLSEKVKKATTKDTGAKDKKATTKRKRETEESLEKSADGAHKKNEKGRKMESLSSEANGNGGKKRKGAVAVGDGGTDTKKRNINGQKDGETTDRVKPSSEKAKKATTKDKGAEKGKEAKKSKKVKFAGEVDMLGDKLVRGKRFSKEEDQLIRDAVYKYIDRNQLGEKGLEMVLKCSKHSKQVKGCWKEIGAAIPGRPYTAVYYRAHIIFERSEKRGFSEEEMEFIKKFHAKNGPNWKRLSELLGKQRVHVKDAWRRIRLPNRKQGRWSQDEYQSLFDLVNLNLRMKAFEEKKPDIPIVKGKSDSTKRENIFWEAISDKLSTRTMSCCCHKWYDQLTSPLVRDGVWADTDDYLLLDALQKQDGCSVEDVDWDSLFDGRSGEVCQRRWEEMLRHLGGYRERTFIEQLDVLTKRYCGDMLQYRFRQHGDEEEKDE